MQSGVRGFNIPRISLSLHPGYLLGGKVNDSVTAFSSDEVIANTIIKAVEKQEKVNAVLKQKGANYRVADIELSMGIPPTVTFGVRRISQEDKESEG